MTAPVLAALVAQAATAVRVTAPPVHDDDPARVLAFGTQVDTKAVRTSRRTDDPDRSLTPEQVAGYLAKYATKSTGDTEAKDNAHLRRLEATTRRLAGRAVTIDEDGDAPYGLLGKWAHTLGSGGTSRPSRARYSVTLGQLRRARQRAQARIAEASRTGTPIDLRQLEAELLADVDDETTVVIGSWTYVGSGWANGGETALAVAAAARAREYAQERAAQRRAARIEEGLSDDGRDAAAGAVDEREGSGRVPGRLRADGVESCAPKGNFAPGTKIGKKVVWRESVLRQWLVDSTEEGSPPPTSSSRMSVYEHPTARRGARSSEVSRATGTPAPSLVGRTPSAG